MSKSENYYQRATAIIPGGVNSPVRAFNGVGGQPIFFDSAKGAILIDVDGQHYIDYIGSWGPMILGHNHPKVVAAVHAAVDRALSFGAPTLVEIEMAECITRLMPHLESVRMVNSGTEATMTAIRLARGITGRDKIIKFNGGYHGHSDSLLVNAGSGALTLGVPSSPGVPSAFAEHTLTARYNDLDSLSALFEKHGSSIATVIIEPVAGNMNCIPARPEFLTGVRQLCDAHGTLLIFDEVMTGFRVALKGATALYSVMPDITTLAKIIGGGFPVGAIAGKKEIMNYLAPVGPVYQAGTLSGNPIAMAAGLATLTELSTPGFYEKLNAQTEKLMQGLKECAHAHHIPLTTNQVCGMFGLFFTDKEKVEFLEDVQQCDIAFFKRFFHAMLKAGVYLAPSAFEAGFISGAHTDEIIQRTISIADAVLERRD